MKKELINEAFRLQQLAGIKAINSLNEEFGYDKFMDAVDDEYEIGTPEHEKLSAAVSAALDNGDIYPMPEEMGSYLKQVRLIAKEIGLDESLNEEDNTLKEENEDMFDKYKDDSEPINSDMSNIKPGDGIVSNSGYFAEFKGVTNQGKYLVIFDSYGEKGVYSKDNFIKRFRVVKKKSDNTSDKKIVYQDEENRLILDKDVDGTYYLVNDFHDEDWDVWTEYETEPSEEQVKLDVEDYLSQR